MKYLSRHHSGPRWIELILFVGHKNLKRFLSSIFQTNLMLKKIVRVVEYDRIHAKGYGNGLNE